MKKSDLMNQDFNMKLFEICDFRSYKKEFYYPTSSTTMKILLFRLIFSIIYFFDTILLFYIQ